MGLGVELRLAILETPGFFSFLGAEESMSISMPVALADCAGGGVAVGAGAGDEAPEDLAVAASAAAECSFWTVFGDMRFILRSTNRAGAARFLETRVG